MCARQHRRTLTVEDARLALEGRAEFSLDLPPLHVALAADEQQPLQALRSRFAATPKKQLFLNTSSEAANAFQYTVRKFWREFEGGSVSAKTKEFIKKKGGFLLQDTLIVLLQAVVAARLVWYFCGRTQPASAPASAARAAAATAVATSSADAHVPAPALVEDHDIGIHTGNSVVASTLEQSRLETLNQHA